MQIQYFNFQEITAQLNVDDTTQYQHTEEEN